MVRKVTLSVKIQAKVNFEGMGAKPLFAQPTPPSVNAQRIAYFSGSSNIYLG